MARGIVSPIRICQIEGMNSLLENFSAPILQERLLFFPFFVKLNRAFLYMVPIYASWNFFKKKFMSNRTICVNVTIFCTNSHGKDVVLSPLLKLNKVYSNKLSVSAEWDFFSLFEIHDKVDRQCCIYQLGIYDELPEVLELTQSNVFHKTNVISKSKIKIIPVFTRYH